MFQKNSESKTTFLTTLILILNCLKKNPPEKLVVILRGMPGCGKTPQAKLLAANGNSAIHSTADLMTDENGNYKYDYTRLAEMHKQNFTNFMTSLQSGKELVILDNTNSKHYEYKEYALQAQELGYTVHILQFPLPENEDELEVLVKESVHQVSRKAMEIILTRWQN